MQINKISNPFNRQISFGKDIVYRDRQIPHKQDQTHDLIRAHLEDLLGPLIFYQDQLEKEQRKRALRAGNSKSMKRTTPTRHAPVKVDNNALKEMKISSFKIQRDNELYSGAQMAFEPEKLNKLKNAGIKTIFSLLPYSDYKENANAVGLNFSTLYDLKDAHISVFDVAGELVTHMIDNPKSWAEDDIPKIKGLKEFIKVLNGESDELPPPIYYGCQNGTDRTLMWTQLYKILKDCPQDEPLSKETVEELALFYKDNVDYFRW